MQEKESKKTKNFRVESDSMGEIKVLNSAYWGAQTQRAIENFSISPLRIHSDFLIALARIKKHAALVNKQKKVLKTSYAEAIISAAEEIIAGVKKPSQNAALNAHFPIDVFQTGSGTSWNMNMNEVLSNRANELLGSQKGSKTPIHPNDHVNKGQSSNDTIPSAIYIAARMTLPKLIKKVAALASALKKKEKEFTSVVKLGRTHLQDAVPMTLGQEFGAFAQQVEYANQQLKRLVSDFELLPQGGTAVGTGLNSVKDFASAFAQSLAKDTGLPFKAMKQPFSRMAGAEPFVAFAGALNTLAVALMKISNDLRLLSSGPRGALGEIILPSLQPGSSIMPGKVNPVIPEMVIQAVAHLMGKSESIKIAAQNAPLQLIMMYPILSHEVLTAIELAANTCDVFVTKCISGIEADKQRAAYWIEYSLALVTPLVKKIGYDKAAALAHKAYHKKKTIRQILVEEKILSKAAIEKVLNPTSML